jgi:hypothetical protein
MAGLLPDDVIAVTLFLQGSVSAHQTRRRSTANASDIPEVLIFHSVGRTKYRSSASSETIFHLGENGVIYRVHYLAEKVEPVYIPHALGLFLFGEWSGWSRTLAGMHVICVVVGGEWENEEDECWEWERLLFGVMSSGC